MELEDIYDINQSRSSFPDLDLVSEEKGDVKGNAQAYGLGDLFNTNALPWDWEHIKKMSFGGQR